MTTSGMSESYCNHLRGQLKEWERAFRSRNGRFPKQPDYEALETDGSARGRLVHGAYMALNRATGDSFLKSLATRESTKGMVIIGGPRQRAADRKNADTFRNAERFRRGGASSGSGASGGNKNHALSQGSSGAGARGGQRESGRGHPPHPQPNKPISQHLAIMERLRAKVQPRPGSSAAAPLSSSGKTAGAGQKVNAVLAAGDGHRRGGATAGKNRLEMGGQAARTAGVSVSRRARAMGMSATAVKNPAAAIAEMAAAAGKRETPAPSSLAGQRKDVERPSGLAFAGTGGARGGGAEGGDAGGGLGGDDGSGRRFLDQESRAGAGARAENEEHQHGAGAGSKKQAPASLQPGAASSTGAIEDSNASSAMVIGVGDSAGTRDEGTKPKAGAGKAGGNEASAKDSSSGNSTPWVDDAHGGESQPAARLERKQPSPLPSENELTPERTATRRVGVAPRGRRGAVTDVSGNKFLAFRTDAGQGNRKKSARRPVAGERSFSGDSAVFSSAGANAVSKGLSSRSGRSAKGSGSGSADAAAAATDEAGLAVAMMNILQSPESAGCNVSAAAAAGGDGAGEGKQKATASNLLLATNIVNTVGGSGAAGTASHSTPSSSTSFSSSGLTTPKTEVNNGRAAAATTATGNTAPASGTICGPGLVTASFGPRRTVGDGGGMDGDWHLRASRAVGRVRGEETAGKAAAAAATVTPAAEGAEAVAAAPGNGGNGSEYTQSRSNGASCGSSSLDTVVPGKNRPLRGSETPALTTQRTERVSDSDGDAGDDSDWSIGGGGGGADNTSRRGKQADYDLEQGAAAAAASRPAPDNAAPPPATRPRPAGAKKRKPAAKKASSEVSDNFVRADLKSRGSSRFKRKGSGRSKARGGSGGRSFGGRGGGGGGGRWGGRGGRGFGGGGRFGGGGGGSKWGGGGSKGAEDPVTGEKGGAPRDRPLSSGAAKNRAGLDVLDQCLDALAVATGDGSGSVAGGGCDEQGNSRPFQRPRNAKEEEELFLRLAPRCPQHQRPGKLLTVRKTGLNKGRKFYACSLPRGEGCDFFMWAEDNPALVLSELTLQETGDEWRHRKATLLSKSLTKLPIPELKKDLKKRQLPCGGKKDDLIKRLVDHAAAELESSATSCVLVPPPSEKENRGAGRDRRASASAHASGEARKRSNPGGGGTDPGPRPDCSSGSGDHGAGSGCDSADDTDDDDDDGGSEFEFAFAESARPAAFPAAVALTPAAAAATPPEEAQEGAADGSRRPFSLPTVPASAIEDTPGVCTAAAAADELGGDGGGGGGGGGGAGACEKGTGGMTGRGGNSPGAAMAADAPPDRCSEGDAGGGRGDVDASTATEVRVKKRPRVALEEAGAGGVLGGDEEDREEDEAAAPEAEEEEEERVVNREPAWASLVQSDNEEDDEGEADDEDGEGGGGGSSSSSGGSGADVAEGRGDSDDDSAWSEEEERLDRAARRRRAERNKRRKLGDGGASGHRAGRAKTAAAAAATGTDREGGDASACDRSGSSDEEEDDDDDDDDEDDDAVEGRGGRKRGGGAADSDGDEAPDLPLTPASALRRVFGHKAFREGQQWGVDRAMKGLPSLLVLATGTGKSLTYQLPALLLPGITVVVSPLVSLMEDQMANLPPQLPGASLSGSHGGLREVAVTVRDLKAGRVKVLFLSPEKLCSPSFRRLASTPGALPPVSLLCVDEAHCVSQWSHNFRPSYLRLGQTLDLLRPRGVLALTATASKAVIKDICATLRIPAKEGVRVGSWDRPNLDVRVMRSSSDDDKRSRLSRLLSAAPLDKGSVVVYVWRQVTAEAVCSLLQGDGHNAVAYHGGMEAGARQKAQAAFMRGRARVVVATVAFGLGVDMRDIRGVVHFDMPKSIENYVQEIGRAGRDGRSARCCLLLCDKDFITHHSLSHSKGLELVQVRGLLRSIMAGAPHGILADNTDKDTAPGTGGGQYDDAGGAGVDASSSAGLQKALSVVDLESRLDVGGAVVETVLSVLEGEPYRLLKLHAVMDDRLVVHFRKRRPSVLASNGEPVVGLLLALGTVEGLASSGKGYSYGHGSAKVSLVRLSEALGWAPTAVVRELRRLQFMGEVEYSLSQRSFHVSLLRGLSATELEEVCQRLHRTLSRAEALEAEKVEAVYLALAAEADGAGGVGDGVSSPPLPRSISGKKRARVGDACESGAGSDGGESSDDSGNGSVAGGSCSSSSLGGPTPAAARSLLHATISRYFDEGSNNHSNKACAERVPPGADGGSTGGANVGDATTGGAHPSSIAIEEEESASSCGSSVGAAAAAAAAPVAPAAMEEEDDEEGKAKEGAEALPHQPLDKRACEVLVRDASVLVTDPSFQGRLGAGFDDGFGGGGSGSGGGLGFFDVATGATAAAGGGGGSASANGMAPHSWLLKDVPMLARAVARVFHGIGSVSFPAAKWRDSAFWARYRQHSFREVKNKLEIAFGARRL